MNINKNIKTLLITLSLIPLLGISTVHADTYGGGEKEITVQIVKEVKLEGDANYRDKVFIDLTNKDETAKAIYFRAVITNKGDEVKNLKMQDFLPSALNKVEGNLTEEWATLGKNESKTFIIKVSLKDSEIIADKNYEKCVVNKAEVRIDGDFAGSDVATVCYGNKPIELPKTGILPVAGFAGLGMLSLGSLLKLSTKKSKK